MNILVTGVGGPTPRSFVRSVKNAEKKESQIFRFVGVDCNPKAYGLYDRTLFDSSYLVPRADQEGYWSAINDIIRKEKIVGAVVLPEVEVLEWAQNISKLEMEIATHLPDYSVAVTLVNKYRLHEYLKETDLVPRFSEVNPSSYNFQKLTEEIGNVFWIRSTFGSSGLGSLKIESEPSLAQWISLNPKVSEFIATEYLPGRNMACKMLYFDGDLKRTACAERVNYIMSKISPSGITGNTSFGRLINEPGLVKLSENALELISSKLDAKLNGIFTIDYKENEKGDPKITEINIRHVAFTSSMAAGGANLPLDTLEAMFADNLAAMERIDYTYAKPLIFLRDVDSLPILIEENELLQN